jgi:hypothetical protein
MFENYFPKMQEFSRIAGRRGIASSHDFWVLVCMARHMHWLMTKRL